MLSLSKHEHRIKVPLRQAQWDLVKNAGLV